MPERAIHNEAPHVVIIGAGFAGLHAARELKRANASITIIDKRNHHLFQPLLYQVATAALSPADIAAPIRRIFSRQRNVSVALADAKRIDAANRLVFLDDDDVVSYDYLVLATGLTHSYFGHDEWRPFAPGLKTTDDALVIRNRFLTAFEKAERTDDEAERAALQTIVIVGAGPTGVELAGTMSEMTRRALPHDFRVCDTRTSRILLIEGEDRVLPAMERALGERAKRDLEELGVEVQLNSRVTRINDDGVEIGDTRVAARTVVWAAGLKGTSIGATIGATTDRMGRVVVRPDLSVPDHPEVFVVGDLARVEDPDTGATIPGLAPAAIQMGKHVGRSIRNELSSGTGQVNRKPFTYHDRGELATIGRARAVGVVFGGREVTGFIAWFLWLAVHIVFLIGFRNRLMVLIGWAYAYLRFQRGARIITEESESSDS